MREASAAGLEVGHNSAFFVDRRRLLGVGLGASLCWAMPVVGMDSAAAGVRADVLLTHNAYWPAVPAAERRVIASATDPAPLLMDLRLREKTEGRLTLIGATTFGWLLAASHVLESDKLRLRDPADKVWRRLVSADHRPPSDEELGFIHFWSYGLNAERRAA